MYEYECIDKVEEGREYKQGVLLDFAKRHKYQLYSETLGVVFWDCEQTKCIVTKVMDKKFQHVNPREGDTEIETVGGIIFAERKIGGAI